MSSFSSMPLLNDNDPNIPICLCGKPCHVGQKRRKGPNQYRYYFCCGNKGEIYQQCQFFNWAPLDKKIVGCRLVSE